VTVENSPDPVDAIYFLFFSFSSAGDVSPYGEVSRSRSISGTGTSFLFCQFFYVSSEASSLRFGGAKLKKKTLSTSCTSLEMLEFLVLQSLLGIDDVFFAVQFLLKFKFLLSGHV